MARDTKTAEFAAHRFLRQTPASFGNQVHRPFRLKSRICAQSSLLQFGDSSAMQNSGKSQSQLDDLQFLLEHVLSREQDTGTAATLLMAREIAAATTASAVRVCQIDEHGLTTLLLEPGDGFEFLPAFQLQELANGASRVFQVPVTADHSPGLRGAVAVGAGNSSVTLELLTSTSPTDEWLIAAAEILAELHARGLTDQLLNLIELRRRLDAGVLALHQAENQPALFHTLVELAPAVQHCNRLAVCHRSGHSRWQLVQITGVASFSDRADAVRDVETTAAAAANAVRHGQTTEDDQSTPPFPWHETRTSTGSPALVLPLDSPHWDNCQHALVAEFETIGRHSGEQIQLLAQHTTVACRPFRQRSAAGAGLRSIASPRGLLAVAVAAALTLLLMLPSALIIEARGKMVPAGQDHLYAPETGVITAIHADDASSVTAGQLIAQLQSPDLSLQLESILGELGAAEARLASLQAQRISRGNTAGGAEAAGDIAETSALVDGLENQRRLLEQRLQLLQITAPRNGQLLSEDFRERFEGRPVQRGQYLGVVAGINGPWQLQLDVAEEDIGYLLSAVNREQIKPQIAFSVDTDPAATAVATLEKISQATELNTAGDFVTRVTATCPEQANRNRRTGSGVTARISCGEYTLGRIWFRRFLDFLRRRLVT